MSAAADAASFGAYCDAIVDRIKPILAGESPGVQGAVVADLAAIWIAGHRDESRAEGDAMREELLEMHCRHVRELLAMYLEGVDG